MARVAASSSTGPGGGLPASVMLADVYDQICVKPCPMNDGEGREWFSRRLACNITLCVKPVCCITKHHYRVHHTPSGGLAPTSYRTCCYRVAAKHRTHAATQQPIHIVWSVDRAIDLCYPQASPTQPYSHLSTIGQQFPNATQHMIGRDWVI